MEAIFGLLHRDPRSPVRMESLKEIATLLASSSPCLRTEGSFGLALKRKIIDSRVQKDSIAVSPDRSLWLTMTGEIEGLEVILRELERAGQQPAGKMDADAVLGMFVLHGPMFVERVQGFFNIVVWDARRRRLFIYADRCSGVRPMYYYQGRGFFSFGSCLKAVIAHHHVPREFDPTALEELLGLAHPIAPRTLFKGIAMLTAGTYLEYGDGAVSVHRYWKRQPYRRSEADLPQLGERYFNALKAAVEGSVDTTVETGILLSGGVDSAAVVSLLHRAGHRRLKTFSIHIGDPVQSDRDASRFIADKYQTDHHSIEDIDADCLELLPEMIWFYEIPGVNFHPTYLLCLEARKHCELVIGGYGNDLIWGVIKRLHAVERFMAPVTPALSVLRYLLGRRCMSQGDLRKLGAGHPQTNVRLLKRIANLSQRTKHPLTDTICLEESLFGDQRVFLELGKFIMDAHDLWIRVPYSDSAVTSVAEAVPPDLRYRKDQGGYLESKSFFKDVMHAHQVLPAEVIYRRKEWMHSPTAEWLRGPLGKTLEAVVLSRSASERGYFDMAGVQKLIGEHRAGSADHTYAFMMLAGLEIWHRLFIDPSAIAKPERGLSAHVMIDS